MVSIKEKTINNQKYLYAEYSFRLPDGSIKKISKLIKSEKDAKNEETKKCFFEKEADANIKYALSKYHADAIINKENIEKIELCRTEYSRIIKKLTKTELKDAIDRFTVNFTYETNAIEGNSLTLKDVTLILTENLVPKGKDLREIYETRNTREANGLLFKNKIKIDIPGIISLHKTLVKDTEVSTGFKKRPNFLLMRDVKTTPPEKVDEEMTKLIEWYAKNKKETHPIQLATRFHGKFEQIHPFEDGNGRTGRILLNAILLEQGYPPIIIRKTVRESYFNALQAFDNGHEYKLERFILEKYKETFNKFFKIYIKYL